MKENDGNAQRDAFRKELRKSVIDSGVNMILGFLMELINGMNEYKNENIKNDNPEKQKDAVKMGLVASNLASICNKAVTGRWKELKDNHDSAVNNRIEELAMIFMHTFNIDQEEATRISEKADRQLTYYMNILSADKEKGEEARREIINRVIHEEIPDSNPEKTSILSNRFDPDNIKYPDPSFNEQPFKKKNDLTEEEMEKILEEAKKTLDL